MCRELLFNIYNISLFSYIYKVQHNGYLQSRLLTKKTKLTNNGT